MTHSGASVEFLGVGYSYGRSARPAITQVDFRVGAGEFCCLVGPNGAGKTTLLKLAAGLLRPKAGRVLTSGLEPSRLPRKKAARLVTYVPPSFDVPFPIDVSSFVGLGAFARRTSFFDLRSDAAETLAALERLRISRLASRRVGQLSQGERKLVLLARALVQNSEIILLDEPTAHLDIHRAVEALEVFYELCRVEGRTVVTSIHDLNVALLFSTKVALLKGGRLVDFGDPEAVMLYRKVTQVFECDVYIGRNELNGRLFVVPMRKTDS